MKIKKKDASTPSRISAAFPGYTPDAIVLISKMLDDIESLKGKLMATQTVVIDLQHQLETIQLCSMG